MVFARMSCNDASHDLKSSVPKFKSGNWPEKNLGTWEAIECASHNIAKPCNSGFFAIRRLTYRGKVANTAQF